MRYSIILLALVQFCFAGTVDQVIKIEASVVYGVDRVVIRDGKVDEGASRRSPIHVALYITNLRDKTLRIPTRGFTVRRDENPQNVFCLDWSYAGGEIGKHLIVPEQDFGFVELRKGETTLIFMSYPLGWPPPETMRLRMEVPLKMADRYSIDFFNNPVEIRK